MGGTWNLGVGVGGPGQLPGPLRRECYTLELGGGEVNGRISWSWGAALGGLARPC